jgi:hypothetical protein
MEKWAESMNKKKKPQQQQNIVSQPTPATPTVSNLVVNEVSKKKDPPTQTTIKKLFEQNKNEVIRRLIEFKKISKNMLLYLVFYKI